MGYHVHGISVWYLLTKKAASDPHYQGGIRLWKTQRIECGRKTHNNKNNKNKNNNKNNKNNNKTTTTTIGSCEMLYKHEKLQKMHKGEKWRLVYLLCLTICGADDGHVYVSFIFFKY